MFVEELALHLSRASITTGNSEPIAFLKSLYAKDFPASFGETLAMDTLVALHGKTRQLDAPFSQQIDLKKMAEVEAIIAPLIAQANWASKVSNYMYETAASGQRTQQQCTCLQWSSFFRIPFRK